MIFELRTYTLHPGRLAEYWRAYEEGGLAAQDPRLRNHLLGYFQTELGPLNQVIHFWKYADLAERQAVRGANAARADWQAHLARIRPLMQAQEAKILVPSPVPGMAPLADG